MSKNALQTCLRKISLRNKKIFKNVLLGLVWWEDSVLLMQRVQVRSLVGEPKIPHTRQWSQKKKEKLCCYKYNTKNDQSLPKNNYLHFKCKHSKMEKHSISCKLAPIQRGQGETKAGGRSLQVSRRQLSKARQFMDEACLGWPKNE